MPVTKPRKTTTPRKKTVKKDIGSPPDFILFIKNIESSRNNEQQQSLISEYAEKMAAGEVLAFPLDPNGNPDTGKFSPFEKELFEKTVATIVTFINSLLKNRNHARQIAAKTAHTEVNSPYVPLTYPRKNYKVKYRLRMKYIK